MSFHSFRRSLRWGLMPSFVGCCAFGFCCALPAQDPPKEPVAPAAAPAATATEPAAIGTALGTVTSATSKVRCWPTDNSPTYVDELVKGMVVACGRTEGNYRLVRLPLGPVGYVHKNYTNPMADGKVTTKGKMVAFRYRRPKSGEVPVRTLAEGSELWVVGEEEDWWRVCCPDTDCWLPASELEVFDPPPETMVKAHGELGKVRRQAVDAYVAGIAAAAAEQQLESERRQKVLALQERLAAELKKLPAEQQLGPLATASQTLLAEIPEKSAVHPAAVELDKRIGAQQWVAEATVARDAKPVPPADLKLPPEEVRDPLERFQAVGFLRWEKGLSGPGRYVVEKGGQRLYLVSCQSGRYDLGVFVGKEVGLLGARRRPATDSLRMLDVERVEVLSAKH